LTGNGGLLNSFIKFKFKLLYFLKNKTPINVIKTTMIITIIGIINLRRVSLFEILI
jgi:hypothetical protein